MNDTEVKSTEKNMSFGEIVKFYYFQSCGIWQHLINYHQSLVNLTQEEYQLLLTHKIEDIENIIKDKEKNIQAIAQVDEQRSILMENFSQRFNVAIKNASQCVLFFQDHHADMHLLNLNQQLISLIEELQILQKRNSTLLKKSLANLKDIQEQSRGIKHFKTYGPNGEFQNTKSI